MSSSRPLYLECWDLCSESQSKGSVHVYTVKKLFMVSDVPVSLDYVRCDLMPITLDEHLVLQYEDTTEGQRAGSVGKGVCCQAWRPELLLRPHIIEGVS